MYAPSVSPRKAFMPANSIKSVEVITDPGAKYDAEGVGGIINIITVKSGIQGYTATIRSNASTQGRIGGGAYLSLKTGKFGITANYNYNYINTPYNDSYLERTNLVNNIEKYMTQNGRSKNKGPFQFGTVEASYEIDTLNLVSLSVERFNGKITGISDYMRIRRPGIRNLNPYINDTDPENISYGNPKLNPEKSHNLNLNYSKFSPKLNINLSLSYRFENNGIESYTFIDPKKPNVSQTTYDNIGHSQRTSFNLYGNWNAFKNFNLIINGGVFYVNM